MNSISKSKIALNVPLVTSKGLVYIEDALKTGDDAYLNKCKEYFKEKYNFKNIFLTSSCTQALEMAAILSKVQNGDEVIIPSFTYVSTANPFVLRGADIVFADSSENSPNMDVGKLELLITPRTKVIVVVHYGGVACEMDKIMKLAEKHNCMVIEDAAHSIDAFYKSKPLGSFGHLATFSFHETKNITCIEGGMLVVNDPTLVARAEVIYEKGTNRLAFNRGEVEKYQWMDIGSSFTMSNLTAAYLYSQLEQLEEIQKRRKLLWNLYYHLLRPLADDNKIKLPPVSFYGFHNAHLFYFVCNSEKERGELMNYLSEQDIASAFHYLSLHSSPFFKDKYNGLPLLNADKFSDCLLRLPLYYKLKEEDIHSITDKIKLFYSKV